MLLLLADGTQVPVSELPGHGRPVPVGLGGGGPGWAGIAPEAPPR